MGSFSVYCLLGVLFVGLVRAGPILESGALSPGHLLYDPAVSERSTVIRPRQLNSTGWTATADSYQPGNEPSNAIDGNANTIWHSKFSPATDPLPHNLTIDMQSSQWISGLNYLPRQDGNSNGFVGRHSLFVSNDGLSWGQPVSTGTWANDASQKSTTFSAAWARYVRLTVYQDAQGSSNQWASAAEVAILASSSPYLARGAWKVSVDGSEAADQTAAAAVDGDTNTFWHTQYSSAAPPYPHYFTIDQGSAVSVSGLSYLPRPAASPNGRIGSYRIEYSSDGTAWTTAGSGSWVDDVSLKVVQFASITARYWRLAALSEAGARGPWASAAEINLIAGSAAAASSSPSAASFSVTASSQETAAANNAATNALDGNLQTFWHTRYSNGVDSFPFTFRIDMLSVRDIYGLAYVPRQDGNANGRIGKYTLETSNDTTTWKQVASGAFFDSNDAQNITVTRASARYVRISSLSEAGNRGSWASAAELTPILAAATAARLSDQGQWGPVLDFPVVPVAVALLPSNKILMWSSYDPYAFGSSPGGITQTAYYDLNSGQVSQRTITNTGHDMFCPGISADFNGRIVVTGGNNAQRTSIYDPASDSWISGPNMNIGRGYQASATLSDGHIYTMGGSWSGGTSDKPGEVYDPSKNTWTSFPGCQVKPSLTNDAQGLYRQDNHQMMFGWRNGTLFHAGPSKAMLWYTPSGQGSYKSAGVRSTDGDAMCGIAAMYDAVNGKILTAGGAPSYQNNQATANGFVITIGAPNTAATTVATGNKMSFARSFHSSVILPDGSVLIVGGQSYPVPFSDDTAVLNAELYSPSTNKFRTVAAESVPRVYHSVALLLPDATVFSGGGGLCGDCSTNHANGQIYSPPYLFKADNTLAARPAITSISAQTVRVGSNVTVATSGSPSSFSLVRFGTATHTVNTDQRRIALTRVTGNGGGRFTVTIPNDPGVALPGQWMLFALTSAGVPSRAQIIKITP